MPKSLGRKVLIVDDNEHIRKLLSDFFSFNGYGAITVSNGREALDILKDKSFSLIITDLNMPVMDGIELVIKIRSLNISLPIIGMSFDDKKSEFLRAGADYFLSKPFIFHHLKSIVSLIFT
jgi:DNA-binding response OmpR family regulator